MQCLIATRVEEIVPPTLWPSPTSTPFSPLPLLSPLSILPSSSTLPFSSTLPSSSALFPPPAGVLSLLKESEDEIKVFALQRLNELVDDFWAEISEDVSKMCVANRVNLIPKVFVVWFWRRRAGKIGRTCKHLSCKWCQVDVWGVGSIFK